MNRGAKAVISLALGAILMLGIYHIYRPQINSMADNTFGKVQRMLGNESSNISPTNNKYGFSDKDWENGVPIDVASNAQSESIPKGRLGRGGSGQVVSPSVNRKYHNLSDDNKQAIASSCHVETKDRGKFTLTPNDIDWNSGRKAVWSTGGTSLQFITKQNNLSRVRI